MHRAGRDLAQKLDAFLRALHDDFMGDDGELYGALNGENFLARAGLLTPQLDRACAWMIHHKGMALHKLAVARGAVAAGQQRLGLEGAAPAGGTLDALAHDAAELRRQARECYRMALALDPARAGASFNLARLADQAGETRAALDLYAVAVADPFYRPHALMHSGLMHGAAANHAEAARCLLEAVALQAHFGPLHVRIADTLRAAGLIDEALIEYAKCVEGRLYYPAEFSVRPPPLPDGPSAQ